MKRLLDILISFQPGRKNYLKQTRKVSQDNLNSSQRFKIQNQRRQLRHLNLKVLVVNLQNEIYKKNEISYKAQLLALQKRNSELSHRDRDREIARLAWDEGYCVGRRDEEHRNDDHACATNPYKHETQLTDNDDV